MDVSEKRRTIRKSITVAFIVLGVFILAGRFILTFFGIAPGSFYVAGGVLFFLIAIDMLFGQPKRTKTSKEEEEDSSSVAVFPLAIPMIAGPGTITTLMLYSSDASSYMTITAMLFVAVTISLAAVAVAMFSSSFVLKTLGRTGVSVIERMMGLILSGLAIQFVFNGLVKLGIVS